MKITKFGLLTATILALNPLICRAEEIDKNTAQMQAMDKITGRVSVINVPVNGEVNFGSLSIVVRSCKTRPIEEAPENFAFVDVSDTSFSGEESNIFKGWMISSSPATNAVEHPIYDVWLLKCLDKENKDAKMLTAEELTERDSLPMQKHLENSVNVANEKLENPINEMDYQAPETAQPQELISEEMPEEDAEFSVDEDDSISEDVKINTENMLDTPQE